MFGTAAATNMCAPPCAPLHPHHHLSPSLLSPVATSSVPRGFGVMPEISTQVRPEIMGPALPRHPLLRILEPDPTTRSSAFVGLLLFLLLSLAILVLSAGALDSSPSSRKRGSQHSLRWQPLKTDDARGRLESSARHPQFVAMNSSEALGPLSP